MIVAFTHHTRSQNERDGERVEIAQGDNTWLNQSIC
jgi:hypothetical protein